MMNRLVAVAAAAALAVALGHACPATAVELSFTDFQLFATGVSVNGQGGWKVDTGVGFDEQVVDDGTGTGNIVWRVSNAVTSGAFGNQPFAPCPGGVPADANGDGAIDGPTETVNGMPQFFAGESSTGASFARFYAELNFRSAIGGPQPGLRVTVSADDCEGGRQSFIALQDSGKGIDVVTVDNNPAGQFTGSITIAKNLSYTEWHTFAVELVFYDGPANDLVRYLVDGKLVHTDGSWEQFYRNFQASLHPDGVPVQTLLFRLSGTAVPGVLGGGYFIDNVLTQVSYSVRPPAN